MAIELTGKTMAEATIQLEGALDKLDTGAQTINGTVLVEDKYGNPIDIISKNQVITKKHLDESMGAYITLNISIPFNIDMDSEIIIRCDNIIEFKDAVFIRNDYIKSPSSYSFDDSISSCKKNPLAFCCKTYGNKNINGIRLPKYSNYTIQYVSDKSCIRCTANLIYNPNIDTYDITINKDAYFQGDISISSKYQHSYNIIYINPNTSPSGYVSIAGYSGGINNGYLYFPFIRSCEGIILPPDKTVELFMLGAGGDGNRNSKYGSGGKHKQISIKTDSYTEMSVIIGATNWSDSKVIIGDVEYSTENGEYSDLADGVYPFDNQELFRRKYGASGSQGVDYYEYGGGHSTSTSAYYGGYFFGAGGAYHDGSTGKGFQGIVIMRFEV